MTKVFVYGTLKRGHGNNRLLEGSRFVGEARTVRHLHMRQWAGGGFPYLIDDAGPDRRQCAGEVYEVDVATLARLDILEGVPHHYQRRPLSVVLAGGVVEVAQAYVVSDRRRAGHEAAPVDDLGWYRWGGRLGRAAATEEEEDEPDVNDGEDYAQRGTVI